MILLKSFSVLFVVLVINLQVQLNFASVPVSEFGSQVSRSIFDSYTSGPAASLVLDKGPKHGKVVVCYIGTWSVYRPNRGSFALEYIEPSLCTHLIYSFAGLDEAQDSIMSLDPWQDLTDNFGRGGYNRITLFKDKYPHLRVSIAIGGWNEGSANYSALVKDPARRGRFVTSAVQFIKKYNFDGLDLDWEFPGKRGGAPEDKENFLRLVKELRSSFKKHNLLLTAALGAGQDTIDVAYDVKGLSLYLDFMHLMCYDYHGAWDSKTGANAPLKSKDIYNVEYTIEYMLKLGAPANKLVMGIPLYGRTFLLKDELDKKPKMEVGAEAGRKGQFTREPGFMGYNEICLEIQNSSYGWKTYWDSESRTPYAVKDQDFVAYDDERSIEEKVRFAIQKGLAGVMVWSIDTDDFHGDCSELHSANGLVNFPLLRHINKAIQVTLDEIEKDKENTIIHGNAEHKSHHHSDSSNAIRHFLAVPILISLLSVFVK